MCVGDKRETARQGVYDRKREKGGENETEKYSKRDRREVRDIQRGNTRESELVVEIEKDTDMKRKRETLR